MPLVIAVYQIRDHRRSRVICDAMAEGIASIGDTVIRRSADAYVRPEADIAVFYGLEGRTPKLFEDYKRTGKAVYVDLGYWGRHHGGRWTGYHKVAVNSRHPTAYFQNRAHDGKRAAVFRLSAQPWASGSRILIAGMGDKGARAERFEPEQWERAAIAEVRRHSAREIVYRPKPSWKAAKPIPGTSFSCRDEQIHKFLGTFHAIVTHHSNLAVDGLIEGVPVFTHEGVASAMGLQDLSKIENPYRPEGRQQWLNDIAYTQFSVAEMAKGIAWRHLKEDGLV